MIIGLANLVIGGRGRDPEDIVVLCFLHHCCVCAHKRENRRGARKNEMGRKGKERKGVTRKWRLYSSDGQYCISREVLFRGRKQFFKRFGVSQWQCHQFSYRQNGIMRGLAFGAVLWALVSCCSSFRLSCWECVSFGLRGSWFDILVSFCGWTRAESRGREFRQKVN